MFPLVFKSNMLKFNDSSAACRLQYFLIGRALVVSCSIYYGRGGRSGVGFGFLDDGIGKCRFRPSTQSLATHIGPTLTKVPSTVVLCTKGRFFCVLLLLYF